MHADELRLPFDDGAFDAVCCFAALHRISEPIGVLREMVPGAGAAQADRATHQLRP